MLDGPPLLPYRSSRHFFSSFLRLRSHNRLPILPHPPSVSLMARLSPVFASYPLVPPSPFPFLRRLPPPSVPHAPPRWARCSAPWARCSGRGAPGRGALLPRRLGRSRLLVAAGAWGPGPAPRPLPRRFALARFFRWPMVGPYAPLCAWDSRSCGRRSGSAWCPDALSQAPRVSQPRAPRSHWQADRGGIHRAPRSPTAFTRVLVHLWLPLLLLRYPRRPALVFLGVPRRTGRGRGPLGPPLRLGRVPA